MSIYNNENITEIQTAQKKENWEKPELSELDINKTESGAEIIGEISTLTAPIS